MRLFDYTISNDEPLILSWNPGPGAAAGALR
jgi:hypothetical protein